MGPGYEHDIFVSYRRSDDDWVRWTHENLVRALRSMLRPALGPVRIFVDKQIETGASWPHHLAQALARSKLMVAVLSRDYFLSQWCRLELALMYNREQVAGLRTAANPSGLIFPVVIDDGNRFPAEVREMQCEPLHDFANPFMRPDSPRQEALADVLQQRLCPVIADALPTVPAYEPAWETTAHAQFESMFQISLQAQTTVPSLTLPSAP